MAVKTVDTTVATQWNNKVPFPKRADGYVMRCINEEFGPNSNNNPMSTLEWEIVNCDPQNIGGKMYEFDGVTFTSYHVTKVTNEESDADNEQASAKAFRRYQEGVLEPCGIDCKAGWDDENPPSVLGKVVYASLWGKKDTSYSSPTPEQIAKGQKVGDPVKDRVTGKELVNYKIQIETIFGLFNGEVRPF